MEKNKRRLTETLIRGQDSAKRLQKLLPRRENDDGSDSAYCLVMEILGSFSGGLLLLDGCDSGEFSGVPASPHVGNLASSVDQTPEVHSGKKPAAAVKERRGCYKRRKTIDSRVKINDTADDGYAWRKYGQKEILHSKHPRCYYRCTHKPVYGCKAQKQVQKLEDGSNRFHITYFGQHTCPSPNAFSHSPLVLDFNDSKNDHYFSNSPSTITNIHNEPSVKHEVESKAQSIDVSDTISSANDDRSSPVLGWDEILGYGHGHGHGHGHEAAISFVGFDHEDSSVTTSSHDHFRMDFLNTGSYLNDLFLDETLSEVNLMSGAFPRFD
ncbi:probable WRKY transcription factor 70 [Cynara cardunculus var. scolymus]|uniref:probable WRKY transcription factor 70 n=1 Tax=Cynara cardunculus var. scolymus TaxID=59895 RepID=UPI000D6304B8|nr:probable WRKY transcription factor 70 [Cynara cardunculus var. scolymus]